MRRYRAAAVQGGGWSAVMPRASRVKSRATRNRQPAARSPQPAAAASRASPSRSGGAPQLVLVAVRLAAEAAFVGAAAGAGGARVVRVGHRGAGQPPRPCLAGLDALQSEEALGACVLADTLGLQCRRLIGSSAGHQQHAGNRAGGKAAEECAEQAACVAVPCPRGPTHLRQLRGPQPRFDFVVAAFPPVALAPLVHPATSPPQPHGSAPHIRSAQCSFAAQGKVLPARPLPNTTSESTTSARLTGP